MINKIMKLIAVERKKYFPFNEKNSRVTGDICRKFAILCVIFKGDRLPQALEMRLESLSGDGFGRL